MAETKKELGQHWLHDERVLQSIVEAGEITNKDYILEIGPGLGTLTKELVLTGATVHALEFDADLIPNLSKMSAQLGFKIEQGDIRTFNFNDLQPDYKIIANIPYYLTSHLIRSISETTNPPQVAVLLIQKEVAQRICAGPGQLSILGVTAQFYFDCSLDIEVPAVLFTPPPKVDSQVLVLRRRKKLLFDVETTRFFQLVKAGFSEKRKTLRNSLSGGLHIEKDQAVELLQQAMINPQLRAQQLSLQEWYTLYKIAEQLKVL